MRHGRGILVALVASTIVGAGASAYGLSLLFAGGDRSGDRRVTPRGTDADAAGLDLGPTCDASSHQGQFDSKRGADTVAVYLPAGPDGACPPPVSTRYRIVFFTGDGGRVDGTERMPACESVCYVFGSTGSKAAQYRWDTNEIVAVAVGEGASTTFIRFYELLRGSVIAYGMIADPDDLAGLHGDDPLFGIGSTATRQDSVTCDPEGGGILVTHSERSPDAETWDVETRAFTLYEAVATVRSVERGTVAADPSGAPPPLPGEQCLVDRPVPTAPPTTEPSPLRSFPPECDASMVQADFDGDADGEPDDLATVVGGGCLDGDALEDDPHSQAFAVEVRWGLAGGVWALPMCERICRAFAAPDLDENGVHELVLAVDEEASTLFLQVLALPVTEAGPVLFTVAAPGTDEHPAGEPMTFEWGGTTTHQSSVHCYLGRSLQKVVVASTATLSDDAQAWLVRNVAFGFSFNYADDYERVNGRHGGLRTAAEFIPTGREIPVRFGVGENDDAVYAGDDICGAPVAAPPSPSASVSGAPATPAVGCRHSAATGDFDGDGRMDAAAIDLVDGDTSGQCEDVPHRHGGSSPFELEVEYATGRTARWRIGGDPMGSGLRTCFEHCGIAGISDLDSDGRQELVIVVHRGASTNNLQIYEVSDPGRKPQPYVVAPPGTQGFPAGQPARFVVAGSVGHQDYVTCETTPGRVIASGGLLPPPHDQWDVREVVFEVQGSNLVVVSTETSKRAALEDTPSFDVRGGSCFDPPELGTGEEIER